MVSESSRRFSLDKETIDPALLNRIFSADGDEIIGTWTGKSINDLVTELDRIEESTDANYSNLPHQGNIPEDLREIITADFQIWACDQSGNCLTGETASRVLHVDQIRNHYKREYGGVKQFKDKIQREIQERNKNLK